MYKRPPKGNDRFEDCGGADTSTHVAWIEPDITQGRPHSKDGQTRSQVFRFKATVFVERGDGLADEWEG